MADEEPGGVVFIVAGELAATLHGAPICALEFEVVRRDDAAGCGCWIWRR